MFTTVAKGQSEANRARRLIAYLLGAWIAGILSPLSAPAQRPGPTSAPATAPATQPSEPGALPKLTLDQLLNTEVTLVSRSPERVAEAASAIQIITGEEIRRSGALSLPEALRLAPNLQVAQFNAHDWAISARGFNGAPAENNAFADKLLVMIDGRTVYSPLFGGVFWDVQNVLLEDIDRIEVVSGPGGSLWGSNAVNGVINIVTKSAKETQGLYTTGDVGSFWQDYGAFRYGGKIGSDLYYRVYGLGFRHDNTTAVGGANLNDSWQMMQTGLRMDYYPSSDDTFTFQGDTYRGTEGDPTLTAVSGGNVLGRWTHVISEDSDFSIQAYFDDTGRSIPQSTFGDLLRTYDLDMQYRFPLGRNQSVTIGAGYRLMDDDVNNSPQLSFFPPQRVTELYSGFAQDEIQLVPERIKLTLGSRLEHNDYTGFELQPSVRLAWTPDERHTIWGAISRTVRSPARFDTDESSPVVITPNHFDSEKVIAYELGYRVRPIEKLSLSVATFYNHYTDVRSVDANVTPVPLIFANDQKANTWGVELSGDLQLTDWWRLRGGYTYLGEDIWSTQPSVVTGADAFEANDPHNQVVLQSMMDLPQHVQFDLVGRYVEAIRSLADDSYFSLDARLAWHYRNVEISVVGQNLLEEHHQEFGTAEIPRSVYGNITFRW